MTGLRTDGYYVTKVPDAFDEYHGGATIKWELYTFVKFYPDGYFAKFSSRKRELDEHAITERVREHKDEPNKYTNVVVTVGKYHIDSHQVFMQATVLENEVNETFTIISTDEILNDNLKEYEFKKSKI